MIFYLGTHCPNWLAQVDIPLFVSDRRLRFRRTLPRAQTSWALDSGSFTELNMHGYYTTSTHDYVQRVYRYRDEIGQLQWAAPQDWMCEPFILAKTGLTVTEHQARTVGNYCELMADAPDLPWIPVVQGHTITDYDACIDRYEAAEVDLTALALVGIGSVCRRQDSGEIEDVIRHVKERVPRLHGFGIKTGGLGRYGALLTSADSMAWSYAGRRAPALAGCGHRNCANCARWAMRWREQVISIPLIEQGVLWEAVAS